MKFCTSCQSTKPEEGGISKKVKGTRRWICNDCVEHRTVSIYKTKGLTRPQGLKKLMAAIYGVSNG